MSYALYSIFFSPSTRNSYTVIGMSKHTFLHNHILLLFINILSSPATAFHHLFTINIFQSSNFPLVSSSPPKLLCDLRPTQQCIYTVQDLCNTLNVSLMALAGWSKTFSVLKNQSFPSINWWDFFFFNLWSHLWITSWRSFQNKNTGLFLPCHPIAPKFLILLGFCLRLTCYAYHMHGQPEKNFFGTSIFQCHDIYSFKYPSSRPWLSIVLSFILASIKTSQVTSNFIPKVVRKQNYFPA